MFYLYIIQSFKDKRWYIGITQDVQNRVAKHNSGSVRSTKAFRPYKLIYTEIFKTKTEARKREITLKRSGLLRKQLKDKLMALSSNG
ncbi:GIY-YIG nuclease family protein [Candidatus Parcubacteria bacterium]|nr:MAG: GIY-YIG nuclease family protein [Candidatus Parcubacteria bacterium]